MIAFVIVTVFIFSGDFIFKTWPLRRQRLSPEQLRRQVTEMASLLGVLDVLHVRAGQLAPATAQRVAIGRALIREDLGLLLLDDAL